MLFKSVFVILCSNIWYYKGCLAITCTGDFNYCLNLAYADKNVLSPYKISIKNAPSSFLRCEYRDFSFYLWHMHRNILAIVV